MIGQFCFPLAGLLIKEAKTMQKRLEVGSHVFIVESNRIITEVIVAAVHGDFCVLRFLTGGAIRLRRNRVYLTRDAAEEQVPKKVSNKSTYYRSPYYYGN